MAEFDISRSVVAQKDYCERENAPHFAPHSGNCWSCGMNIYEQHHWIYEGGMRKRQVEKESATVSTGITIKEASEALVTGCPHCNRSYCD